MFWSSHAAGSNVAVADHGVASALPPPTALGSADVAAQPTPPGPAAMNGEMI